MQIISQYFSRYTIPEPPQEPFDLKEFENDILLNLPLETLAKPEVLEKIIAEKLEEKMKEIEASKNKK